MLCLQAPNFNSLSGVSLAAAFMSLSYSTIAFAGSINVGKQPDAVYNLNGYTKADGIFGVFNALGTVAFAYGGHNVILEIQVCCLHMYRRCECVTWVPDAGAMFV